MRTKEYTSRYHLHFSEKTFDNKKVRIAWLGLLPIAHAHTLFIAYRMTKNPTFKAYSEPEILQKAWEVQLTSVPSILIVQQRHFTHYSPSSEPITSTLWNQPRPQTPTQGRGRSHVQKIRRKEVIRQANSFSFRGIFYHSLPIVPCSTKMFSVPR